jgi:hypothetical protein
MLVHLVKASNKPLVRRKSILNTNGDCIIERGGVSGLLKHLLAQ